MPLDPYDQREADARDEDLRQRRAENADEAFNERRQLRKPDVAERAMRNVMAVLGIDPRRPPDDLTNESGG